MTEIAVSFGLITEKVLKVGRPSRPSGGRHLRNLTLEFPSPLQTYAIPHYLLQKLGLERTKSNDVGEGCKFVVVLQILQLHRC